MTKLEYGAGAKDSALEQNQDVPKGKGRTLIFVNRTEPNAKPCASCPNLAKHNLVLT